LEEPVLFLFSGFFVPANLHASLDFAFEFSKIGMIKPSDTSSERIESLAMPVKKSGGSSFTIFGEKDGMQLNKCIPSLIVAWLIPEGYWKLEENNP